MNTSTTPAGPQSPALTELHDAIDASLDRLHRQFADFITQTSRKLDADTLTPART